MNGACEEEMEVCENVPQHGTIVTKSLTSDVMSDKSIDDISENSLSDNASNYSKDFNNAENFSVNEREDMKVPNSENLSESEMCKDLGTEVPRVDEEEEEEEGEEEEEVDDDENEDEMKDIRDEDVDKNEEMEIEESGLDDGETQGSDAGDVLDKEEGMDTDTGKEIPGPTNNCVKSRNNSLGSDAESCGEDEHDASEDRKDELLGSRGKDNTSCVLENKAVDLEGEENVSDETVRSENANHVGSFKEAANSSYEGDSSFKEDPDSLKRDSNVSKEVSGGCKGVNPVNAISPDIEEISNDSLKSSKSVKSTRNEGSEGNGEAAEKEDDKKDVDTDASDSKGGDNLGKVKKARKSAALLNLTPRRSSRNLSKVQKSYVEKEEDPDIEEITPEDPLADPLSTDHFRDDKENNKTRSARKTTIVVNDTKRLVEIATGTKGVKGGKKEPTLVIIDTNSILSGRGPVPVSQGPHPSSQTSPVPAAASPSVPAASSSGYSILPVAVPAQGMYPSHSSMRMSSSVVQPPPSVPKPPQILPTLTDDMYVVEAPSFIVPYVYEKPPIKPLKEFVEKLGKEIEEMKEKEERERQEKEEKEKNEKEPEEENKAKERDMEGDKEDVIDQKESNKDNSEKSAKEEDCNEAEEKDNDKEDDVNIKDSSDANESKCVSEDKDECGDKDVKAKGKGGTEGQVKSSEDKSGEEKRESEDSKKNGDNVKKSGSELQNSGPVAGEDKDKPASLPKPEEKPNRPPTYFDNPLGKFFMQIGINLVQEYVQTDLLRSQKRKRERDGGKGGAVAQFAINSLLKNLELSKENNEPFHLEQKKCEYCSFKTESSLVMAQHLETPHMRNYVYRCNFCPLEVRSPHDILFHMEAEHNVRGRLERAPAFHQCPNCPFEDNQKGKLTRHLLSCAKKHKPERNQEPPPDWEPPAKIPRVSRSRPASLGLGAAAYQAMAGKQVQPHHPLLPKLVPAPSLTSPGLGRGRGRPPIHARYHMPDMKVPPQRGVVPAQIRQGKSYICINGCGCRSSSMFVVHV